MTPPPPKFDLFHTLPGRLFVVAAVPLGLLLVVQQFVTLSPFFEMLRRVAGLALVVSIAWLAWLAVAGNRRRFLWRVRRKLILSYVLLGVMPTLLVAAFALVGGFVLYTNVTGYIFHEGFGDIVDDVEQAAETAAGDISRRPGSVDEALTRRYESLRPRYPEISLAWVPISPTAGSDSTARSAEPSRAAASAGAWRHLPAPQTLPRWVSDARSFSGVLSYLPAGPQAEEHLLIRAATATSDGRALVVVDLPVDTDVVSQLDDRTGTRMGRINLNAADGTLLGTATAGAGVAENGTEAAAAGGRVFSLFRQTVAFMDFIKDWSTGEPGRATVTLEAPLSRIYARMVAPSPQIAARLTLVPIVFGILFLIIQGSALVMGGLLARSITYAVHELFAGTERVRQGDFSHRIAIESSDQLGDLADSFNRMSASMVHLLHVQREKQQMDDELRIAREIQKSLLPVRPPDIAGLTVADLCEPAREVGGDYYDFFDLGDRRVGVLVADVSGKGTSAALYMAELKGIMLALSHSEPSPRKLLIDVNRLLVDQLDNRSFITMTYAVIDLAAGTLTCARAGHTPLIVVSGGKSEVIVPQGMVVGLRLPGAERRFEELLQDHTRTIGPGDVIVLYTDGVTEAMDNASELFGDAALAQVLEANHRLDPAGIRERVLREVRAFVGDAEPHDDMTMIVLKIGGAAA